MECVEAKGKMESYASDRLGEVDRAALEQHIASCEGCRLEVELVRAMGSTPAKPEAGNNDEWTIDRIFGAGASRAPETAPASPSPAGTTPVEPAAPFTPEQLAPPESAPSSSGAAPASPATVAGGDSGADALFEKVPAPPPPEPAAPERAPAPASIEAMPAAASEAPDSETSFAGLELESIQDSSVAASPSAPSTRGVAAGAGKPGGMRPSSSAASAPKEDNWNFEPADARPDGQPPEGSLFFAEEALTRQAAARKGRSSTLRTFLWAAGSVVGLALLFLSIWIAIGVQRPSQSPAVSIRKMEPVSAPPTAERQTEPAAPAAPAATEPTPAATDAPANAPAGTGAPASPGSATAPTAAAKAPAIEAGVFPTGGAPLAEPSKSTARPPREGTVAPSPVKHGLASGTTTPRPLKTPPPASKTPPPAPKTSPVVAAAPESRASAPPAATKEPGVEAAPSSPPSAAGSPGAETPALSSASAPPSAAPPPAGSRGSEVPAASSASAPPAAAPPAAAPSTAPVAPAAAPHVDSASDRLHVATVNAAQNSDLGALRKLRDTWKSFVRSNIGPERSRAKRELADCLWDIQTLTGRDSDKKEALAAYRDYILNAPAGGADARTVARMRQLEDAMADSR